MKKDGGFTLIELVVVIVILGVLAATALPKFVDLKSDAEAAAIKGVAGAVSSAFAVNIGAYQANTAKGVAISGAAVNVNNAAGSIMQGGMPVGYTVTAAAATVACGSIAANSTYAGSAGVAHSVTISNTSLGSASQTASATLICTG